MRSNAITAESELVSWKVGRELVRGGQVRDLEREWVQWGPYSRGEHWRGIRCRSPLQDGTFCKCTARYLRRGENIL